MSAFSVTLVGRLADACRAYDSLAEDMADVQAYLHQLVTLPEPEDDVRPISHQAYWAAAVVTYARCFGAGSRKAYAESARIPPRLRRVHDWVLQYRNNNIAHLSRTPIDQESNVELLLSARKDPRADPLIVVSSIRRLYGEEDRLLRLADNLERQYTRLDDAVRGRIADALRALDERTIRDAARHKRPIRLDG